MTLLEFVTVTGFLGSVVSSIPFNQNLGASLKNSRMIRKGKTTFHGHGRIDMKKRFGREPNIYYIYIFILVLILNVLTVAKSIS